MSKISTVGVERLQSGRNTGRPSERADTQPTEMRNKCAFAQVLTQPTEFAFAAQRRGRRRRVVLEGVLDMGRPIAASTPPDPVEELDSDEFFADDFLLEAAEDEELGVSLGWSESPRGRSVLLREAAKRLLTPWRQAA